MRKMLSRICLCGAASLCFAAAGARAQEGGPRPSPPDRSGAAARLAETLSASGVEVGPDVLAPASAASRARSHREVAVSWEAADKAQAPRPSGEQHANAPGRFSRARAAERRGGGLPKQRSAEVGHGQLVVVALDKSGRLRWWGTMADPRLLRAEWPGPEGELTGRTVYKEAAEFLVHFPDDDSIDQLRLYHPEWDGGVFSLKQVGAVTPR